MSNFGFLQSNYPELLVTKLSNTTFRLDHVLVILLLLVSFTISSEQLVDKTLTIRFLGAFAVLLLGYALIAKRAVVFLGNQLNWLDVSLFAFSLWQVISIFWATNKAEAFGSSFRSVALFLTYLFLKIIHHSDLRWKKQLPLLVSIVCSAYLVLTCIELFKIGEEHGLNAQSVYLLQYPTETKNLGSIFLLISIAFHLQLVVQYANWKRWFGLVNALIALGTLFLFSTRGISLSFAAIGGFLVLSQIFGKHLKFKYGVVVGIALMALGVGHWFASNMQKTEALESHANQSNIETEEPQEESPEHAYRSANERLALWEKTLGLIKQDPILGVGAGNWQIEYPRNGLEGLERAEFRVTSFKRPHNEALSILSEAGVVGLILFLLIVAFFFQSIWKGERINLFAGAGMMGLLVSAMFDFPRERMEHTVLFAAMLALVSSGQPIISMGKRKLWAIYVALILLMIGGIVIYYMRFDGERNYDKLRRLKAQEKYAECIRYAEKVENPFYTVDWINYPIAWFVGMCYTYQHDFQSGEVEFRRALKLNPGNFHTHNNLGFCLAQQKKYEQAIPFFESCLTINSKFEEARFNLAYSLIMTKQAEPAFQALSQHITDTAKKKVYLHEIEKIME